MIGDWSSYVCSSDLSVGRRLEIAGEGAPHRDPGDRAHEDRADEQHDEERREDAQDAMQEDGHDVGTRSALREQVERQRVVSGKGVKVSVELGGGRIIKQKKKTGIQDTDIIRS